MLEAMETHCLETLHQSVWICQSVSTSLRDNVRDLFRVIVLLLGQPTPGAGSAANMRRASIVYWMTSSARPSSDGGIVRPSRLGGFEVDHQLEFRWLLDGKISGLGALEDQVNTYPQFAPCFPELPRFEMDCLAVSSLFGSRGSIRPGPTRDDL